MTAYCSGLARRGGVATPDLSFKNGPKSHAVKSSPVPGSDALFDTFWIFTTLSVLFANTLITLHSAAQLTG